MLADHQIDQVRGTTVYGADGDKIGKAGEVYLDDQSGRPEWVTVNTGLFGTNESFVPLADADLVDDGLRVPFAKDVVKDAPNVDPGAGHLSREEEQALYRHYGLSYDGDSSGGVGGNVTDADRYGDTRDLDDTSGTVAQDTSGPNTDDAMTRSEERLNVGTRTEETGRARLRKHVVTEQQSVEVPVKREEVRIEREPITDANVGDAMSGPAISEEEAEVTLREERPVVETEAVPVERVRLAKDEVTDTEQVSAEVRKEQIDTDVDGDRR
jgi:uncharacterized protein (TIGR02271 family)